MLGGAGRRVAGLIVATFCCVTLCCAALTASSFAAGLPPLSLSGPTLAADGIPCSGVASAVCTLLSSPATLSSAVINPPDVNDWSCRLSAAHPEPLVLVHGFAGGESATWVYDAPQLAERGYCVYSLNYGVNPLLPGVGGALPIQDSAVQLGTFVHRVLAATGAHKIDLVGHSEGTFMPQYWLKELGGASEVDQYIALNPLYNGTKFPIDLLSPFCVACSQAMWESPMVKLLQRGGIAAPGVHYTAIMSRYDEIVVPYTSGYIDEPGQRNIVIQDVCPNDIDEHLLAPVDPVVLQLILNALDPATAQPVSCAGLPPIAPPLPNA